MIFDEIDNRTESLRGEPWDRAFEFIAGLDTDAAEGRYELDGDAMFAVIECYDTRSPDNAMPEAHREYIDIQLLLSGHEQVAWWPTDGLEVRDPYNPEKDIVFFDQPDGAGAVIDLAPGRFAVFFPGDAHMPCLHPGPDPAHVKKVVIKIRR